MTDAELQAIRERVEAATQGPWTVQGEIEMGWSDSFGVCICMAGSELPHGPIAYTSRWIGRGDPMSAQPEDYRDAAFIAHARADVPALLDEVTRLRDELADDYMLARLAIIRARKAGVDPYRIADIWVEQVRLSHAEHAVREAIYRACEWRRCAGWADPYAADERRVDVTQGDD